jgi:hypothetical protein
MKMEKSCHKSEQAHGRPGKCDNTNCNPFMACATGNFYTVEKSFAEYHLIFQWSEKMHPRDDNRLAFCMFECWHPPESM